MPKLVHLALLLLLIGAAAPVARAVPGETRWEDVELPRGFHLDLRAGRVTDQAPEGAGFVFRAGRLESSAALYRLPPFGAEPRPRVERGVGEAISGVEARAGAELVYDLGAEGWGYLRVLRTSPDRVRLEQVHGSADVASFVRRPLALAVRAEDGGLALSWREAAGGPTGKYRIERRFLPRGPEEVDAGWEVRGEVRGLTWIDEQPSSTRIGEYRVQCIEPGAPFGARARGVRDLLGADRPVTVARGMELSLLTGREDPARVDLSVQHVNESLVQLAPGPGVLLRNLTPAEEDAWSLPEVNAADWSRAPVFTGPGRSLAA